MKTAKTRGPQIRGQERRKALVAAARALLGESSIRDVTLADIAGRAGIPATSAYHFFPDIQGIYSALVTDLEAELLACQNQVRGSPVNRWQELVGRYMEQGAGFFRDDRCARQLMLGPYSPPAIKLSDRDNDYTVAMHLMQLIDEQFVVPEMQHLPDVFFHSIEIADLFFSLSVIRYDDITPHYVVEATRAALAYLEIYLPAVLLFRRPESSEKAGGPPGFSR